jgi:hypothetical protein
VEDDDKVDFSKIKGKHDQIDTPMGNSGVALSLFKAPAASSASPACVNKSSKAKAMSLESLRSS